MNILQMLIFTLLKNHSWIYVMFFWQFNFLVLFLLLILSRTQFTSEATFVLCRQKLDKNIGQKLYVSNFSFFDLTMIIERCSSKLFSRRGYGLSSTQSKIVVRFPLNFWQCIFFIIRICIVTFSATFNQLEFLKSFQ